MRTLSEEGTKLAEDLARQHGVAREAVVVLLQALERGNGVQAQFSHPDLGGTGQWSRGGMIMIGDMFNNALKARVDALCTELSGLMQKHAMFKPVPRGGASSQSGSHGSWQSQSQGSSSRGFSSPDSSWQSPSFASAWWPEDCGTPSASGGQNDMRYACFPDTHRVAIEQGGVVRVFDTAGRRITGVSQQQSGSQDLTFTGPDGVVRLRELSPVSEHAASRPDTPEPSEPVRSQTSPHPSPESSSPRDPSSAAPPPSRSGSADQDIFAKIERLHELAQRGVLSDAEFAEKKKELLARL